MTQSKRAAEATDILLKLEDLLEQATHERSHFYVASTCLEAIQEIKDLRAQLSYPFDGLARQRKGRK